MCGVKGVKDSSSSVEVDRSSEDCKTELALLCYFLVSTPQYSRSFSMAMRAAMQSCTPFPSRPPLTLSVAVAPSLSERRDVHWPRVTSFQKLPLPLLSLPSHPRIEGGGQPPSPPCLQVARLRRWGCISMTSQLTSEAQPAVETGESSYIL